MSDPLPFPFRPDWTNTITERLSWLTAIATSRSGAEQRQALRLTPRRQFDIPLVMSGQERSYFDILMARNGGGVWNVPIPHEEIPVGSVDARQQFFYLDPTYREIGAGTQLLLRSDCFHAEIVEVIEVTDVGIATMPTVLSYDAASLTPTFLGVMTEKVTASRQTARVLTGTVRFSAVEPSIWPKTNRLPDMSSFTYAGQPFYILPQEPNGVSALDYDFDRTWLTVDNSMSIPQYIDQSARQFASQKYSFFLVGGRERQTFRDLLYALKGRLTPLWVPTFNDDMAVDQGYPNPLGLPDDPIPGREFFLQFLRDGTVHGYSAPAYDGIPAENFSNNLVFRNSFMSIKRLDVDDIEIEHHSGIEGAATASVIFRDAPDLRVPSTYSAVPYPDPVYHTTLLGDVVPTDGIPEAQTDLYNLIVPHTIGAGIG